MSKKINFKFDSDQERYFYYWLEELYNAGYIDLILADRKSFDLNNPLTINWTKQLKTKNKPMEISLIKTRSYTPDFIFRFTKKAKNIFYFDPDIPTKKRKPFMVLGSDDYIYVDVKGQYTRTYTSSITFGDRQAILWDKYKIFVQIVKPYIREGKSCLFEKTFTPRKVLKEQVYLRDNSKRKIKKGDSKIKYKVRKLNEFVKEELNEL